MNSAFFFRFPLSFATIFQQVSVYCKFLFNNFNPSRFTLTYRVSVVYLSALALASAFVKLELVCDALQWLVSFRVI